jgi:serine/threonine protein phosphatase 1
MSCVAVVGDIHGNIERLRAALRALDEDGRHVIFVGDYVNWGESSSAVLEELSARSLKDPTRYTFLVGNHEIALLAYLADGKFPAFAATGGVPTIRSYLETVHGDVHAAFDRAFPASHRAFLQRLEPYWDDGEVLVSHAGFDPEKPALRSVEAMVTAGGGSPFSARSFPRDLVVCGHYVQSSGAPYVGEHLICIDTGCGSNDGPLTIAWLPERTFTAV